MMRDWAANLFLFLARRRLMLALAVTTIIGLASWRVCDIKLDMSLKALMPDSSAQLRQSAELFDLAPFAKVLLIQLTAGDGREAYHLAEAADDLVAGLNPELLKPLAQSELPDPAGLMALLPTLCDDVCLKKLKASVTKEQLATALAGLKTELAGSGGPGSLFWRADPLNWRTEVFRHFPATFNWPITDPLLGYPITKDGRHLLIMARPRMSMNDTVGAVAVMDHINALTSELPEGISAQVTGAHRHTAANAAAIERDLTLTMTLAMVLILAIYLFLVRSFAALWLFLTPAVAVALAAAGLSSAFALVSGLALGFGAAVLGIAEDYAVHVHYALRRAPKETDALRHVARPLLMSTILCVAGFGVLLFSAIPAIRQLAFFSAAAIIVGYIWAIVVLPHCPSMNKPREEALASTNNGHQRVGGPVMVWPVLLALAGLSFILVALIPFRASVRDLGFADSSLMSAQQSLEKNWQLDGGRRLYLAEGKTLAEALAVAESAVKEINTRPGSAASLASLMPGADVQAANLKNWQTFREGRGRGLIEALTLEAAENGYAPEAFQPFFTWLTAEPETITAETLEKAGLGLLTDSFLAQKNGIHYALVMAESNAPVLPENFSEHLFQLSATEFESALGQALTGEKRLLPFCIILCLIVLIRAFHNFKLAGLAFIPALGGLTAVLAIQLFTGRPMGLVEAAALPLVICLGADYGIVVVSELTENADLGAPMAIFVSGLSTIAGIGILVLASHPVLHSLGKTVLAGLAAAMPVSILLLPKLWKKS